MRKFLAIIITFVFFQSCKVESTKGQWKSLSSEQTCNDSCIFKSPLQFYDSNAKLQYSIANDNENLYIYIKATEKIAQIKILKTGILLKIDSSGKQKDAASILYPIPNSKKGNTMPVNSQSNWDIFISRFSYDHAYMKIKGFSQITDDEILTTNPFGISVSVSWDDQEVLRYKAVVPFSQIFKNSPIKVDTNKVVSFGIILAPVVDKAKQTEGSSTALSSSQENAMKRGNAMRGYNTTGQLTDEQSYLVNLRTIKFNYSLAKNPH
jgi:hypothetical protein